MSRRRPFWYLRRRRDAVAADIDEELRHHLSLRARQLRAQGMSAEAADAEARRQFGDLEYTRRYCSREDLSKETHMRRGLMLEEVLQDLRISFRSLRHAPIMSATVLATVGLGIGATTVILTAVNVALLRPLPYPQPDRLVRIYMDAPPNRFRFSVADHLALESRQTAFERVAAYTERGMTFSDAAIAERVRVREVTWTYPDLLGLRPALGRAFTAADGAPGGAPAIMVTHGFWTRHLGARADAPGRTVRLDGRDHVVAAVLPQTLGPLEEGFDVFVAAQWSAPPRRGPFLYTTIARLRPGVDRAAAAEELRAINRHIFPLWRSSFQDERATWSMIDLKEHVVGNVGTVSAVALAAVVLVWLIACVNASNLLIARVTSRRRELAVRAALGASRGRVVRFLLAESSLLAAGAVLAGGALAWWGIALLRHAGAAFVPRSQEIVWDASVVGILAVLAGMSALLFGAIPAVHGTAPAPQQSLRAEGPNSSGSVAVERLRRLLIGSQFAVATPLIVVAALLGISLHKLGQVDVGFDGRTVVSGSIALPAVKYVEPAAVGTFWSELRLRLAALPGVTAVAFADGRPPQGVGNFNNFDLEEFPAPAGQSQPVAPWVAVTPEYFRLLGLHLVDGRLLDEADARRESLESVVVDEAWVRRFFPGRSAVGKRFREGGCTTCPWTTVVGVVTTVKYAGLNRPDEGTVYWPMVEGTRTRFLMLRTGGDPTAVLPDVRRVLRDLDPAVPFSNVATAPELVTQSLTAPRSLTLLVVAFAGVAALLSILGIYGVMAFYVQQRAKDISIRVALGGTARDIVRLILTQALRVVSTGVVVGVAAALLLTQWISSLLFGVDPLDPVTIATVAAGLLATALTACLIPVKRALGRQPALVLRGD